MNVNKTLELQDAVYQLEYSICLITVLCTVKNNWTILFFMKKNPVFCFHWLLNKSSSGNHCQFIYHLIRDCRAPFYRNKPELFRCFTQLGLCSTTTTLVFSLHSKLRCSICLDRGISLFCNFQYCKAGLVGFWTSVLLDFIFTSNFDK